MLRKNNTKKKQLKVFCDVEMEWSDRCFSYVVSRTRRISLKSKFLQIILNSLNGKCLKVSGSEFIDTVYFALALTLCAKESFIVIIYRR